MEIMLVVTIIALLAGLAMFKMGGVVDVSAFVANVFTFGGAAGHSGIAEARTDIQSFRTSLTAYRAMAGSYPSTAQGLQALVKRPEGEPKPLMWHQTMDGQIKQDPWRHDFVYKCPGDRNPQGYDLCSIGPDGRAGTDDDIWPN